jgi:hypothetical protein
LGENRTLRFDLDHTKNLTSHRAEQRCRPLAIASLRCTTEFGRYRGMADIDNAAPIKIDL